jgi:23S rRNA (adenine2030-N6)-methyltransferase
MTRKETPFLYIDTHAGAGAYRLEEGYAAQNREWEGGAAALARATAAPLAPALTRYHAALAAFRQAEGGSDAYPGSPALAFAALRPQDRAAFFELHGADFELLSARYRDERRVRCLQSNGFASLKSLLPPPSRRALVLMDPSYELAADYEAVVAAADEGLRRLANAVILVWYPLLSKPEAKALPDALAAAAARRNRPWLDARLSVAPLVEGARGMTGSGVFSINPSYGLADELAEALPELAAALGGRGSWELQRGGA